MFFPFIPTAFLSVILDNLASYSTQQCCNNVQLPTRPPASLPDWTNVQRVGTISRECRNLKLLPLVLDFYVRQWNHLRRLFVTSCHVVLVAADAFSKAATKCLHSVNVLSGTEHRQTFDSLPSASLPPNKITDGVFEAPRKKGRR